MKPRSFGEVFVQAAGLVFVAIYGIFKLTDQVKGDETFYMSLFVGICMGFVAANHLKGESFVKEYGDPKKAMQTLAVLLVGCGYSLEAQTETLHTFKPPFSCWLGGRISLLAEGQTVQIVGPHTILKQLREV
jgi:hypothetical protein